MKLIQNNILNLILLLAVGCTQIISSENPTAVDEPVAIGMEAMVVPDNFDYATTTNAEINVVLLDNQDMGISGVRVDLLQPGAEAWEKVASVISDTDGRLTFNLPIATAIEELLLETDYIGLPQMKLISSDQFSELIVIGGSRTSMPTDEGVTNGRMMSDLIQVGRFFLLDDHDNNGVPYNLMEVPDHVSQDLLDLVNTSLPETYPVPEYNPQYLADNITTNTLLKDSAEVWVTFVHEGAGWTNTLGYYTYPLDNPPATANDIDSMFIIFPNVSYAYSGGDLYSGDKVYLGSFSKNTGIGWFLIPQGWNRSTVVDRSQIKYSDKSFNTFTNEEYRQHTVLLKDDNREILLLGMEDTSRPGGDNDFNDAVFYVTASPYTALITDELESTKVDGKPDSDEDGVADQNDDYPNDPDKAFNIYTPSENTYGSLAFEDQWPSKGDYDMNDLVVDYNFKFVTNTANKAVQMDVKLKIRAIGALYHNGFGIELPIAPSSVSQITSDDPNISLNLDNGTNKATLMIFEDAHAMMSASGHVNTVIGEPLVETKEINFTMYFQTPIAMAAMGYAPFNPFITSNGDRTIEIHLPDKSPTPAADMSLLGAIHDKSDITSGTYYKSYNNLPWAINVPVAFDYPDEFSSIDQAHLKFKAWAESGGTLYQDWYKANSGYRNNEKIFK